MDDLRVGSALRALRLRANLRQLDVARRASVSQSLVSQVEGGRIGTVTIETLRRMFAAVGARFDGEVRWRGPSLDRLIDARHAAIVDAATARLVRLGWQPLVEVTYSVFGERGSIDVLAGRETVRAVVVEEVKSIVTRVDDTVRKLDEKTRLVRERIAFDRFGWRPATVGRILVLPDSDQARRFVARHRHVFDASLPASGAEVRTWLRDPVGDISGIWFVADISPDGRNVARPGTQRVRARRRVPPPGVHVASITAGDDGDETQMTETSPTAGLGRIAAYDQRA